MGMVARTVKAPIRPPIPEERKDAPMARSASPFLAIGKPSITVAVAEVEPGIPKRIAGMVSAVLPMA